MLTGRVTQAAQPLALCLEDQRIGFPFPAVVKISLFITEFRVREIVLSHHSRAKGKIGVLCSLRQDNAEPT